MAAPLDRFLADADVRERFETRVSAPADVALRAGTAFDLQSLPVARAIFRARELILGAEHVERPRRGLLDDMQAIGWGVLETRPDRHVVCGSICQPWRPDVTFIAIPPGEFAGWSEPGWVKIAWTLEAEPLPTGGSSLAHETRARATDAASRTRFMRYWHWARFGIVAIRLLYMPAVRRAAERSVTT